MATRFKRVQSASKELNDVQDNVESAVSPLLKNSFLEGTLLQNVVLKSGANTVGHGLGRTLTGWVITRIRAQAQVWDSQDANQIPSLTLVLNASTGVTVDLYIF